MLFVDYILYLVDDYLKQYYYYTIISYHTIYKYVIYNMLMYSLMLYRHTCVYICKECCVHATHAHALHDTCLLEKYMETASLEKQRDAKNLSYEKLISFNGVILTKLISLNRNTFILICTFNIRI